MNNFFLLSVSTVLSVSSLMPMIEFPHSNQQEQTLEEYKKIHKKIDEINQSVDSAIKQYKNTFSAGVTSVAVCTQLQQDVLVEQKVLSMLQQKPYEVIEGFADRLADQLESEYPDDVKRMVANYLCDTKGLHYYAPVGPQQDQAVYENSDELQYELLPIKEKIESKPNSRLYNFVKKHHTSMATVAALYPISVAALYPQSFKIGEDTLSVIGVGLRSLIGLRAFAQKYYSYDPGCHNSIYKVKSVNFTGNHLQSFAVQKIKNVFPDVTSVNCDKNPLVSADFTGAAYADTFFLKSTRADALKINIASLNTIWPINIYLAESSVSQDHKRDLLNAIASIAQANKWKKISINITEFLVLASMGAIGIGWLPVLLVGVSQGYETAIGQGLIGGTASVGAVAGGVMSVCSLLDNKIVSGLFGRYKSHYINFEPAEEI